MSPAWIRPRDVKKSQRNPRGRTYQVLYRRGGRLHRIETAGTFKTEKDAKLRRDLVAGWLAQGLDPKAELAKLATAETPAQPLSFERAATSYVASRIDYADETTKNARSHVKKLLASPLGSMLIRDITVRHVQETVAWLAESLKPASVSRYVATLRLVLDLADADPNPARDTRVKLPTIRHVEAQPPTGDHFLKMLNAMPKRYWRPLIAIEQTAMTIGETSTLEWQDVDVVGCRFRLRRSQVKGQIKSRARWVQVPPWLMSVIADSCAPEDRLPDRRVFANLSPDVAKNAMARACRTAGIPLYSPHDLRHRRITLWHHQGVPAKELADRAGHSRASMSLDVYSHVMPIDEVPELTLETMLVMTP